MHEGLWDPMDPEQSLRDLIRYKIELTMQKDINLHLNLGRKEDAE